MNAPTKERDLPEPSFLQKLKNCLKHKHVMLTQLAVVAACGGVLFAVQTCRAQADLSPTLESYAKVSEKLKSISKRAKAGYQKSEFIANWSNRLSNADPNFTAAGPDSPGAMIHGSEIVIQIKPSTPADEVSRNLASIRERFSLELVDSVPDIGVILVRLPETTPNIELGAALTAQVDKVTASKRAEARRAATLQAIVDRLRTEQWVRVATPNTVLSSNIVPNPGGTAQAVHNGEEFGWDWSEAPGSFTAAKRDGNWGLKYMNFPAAWNFRDAIKRRNPPPRPNAPTIGVLDNGFGTHEDLAVEFSPITQTKPEDHGFHVAGIIAGSWNGARGVEGCVPDASLMCATMQSIPFVSASVQQPAVSFVLIDIIANTQKFISEHRSVRVINVSLGYNWRANEGINPNNHRKTQEDVSEAGRIMRTIAEIARERGIIIVSAAGNDSRTGSVVDAQWASPFNWAALNHTTFDGVTIPPARNIIVVESIGRAGKTSWFSNVRGCVAAPGEKVLSTVWTNNPFRAPGEPPQPATSGYAPLDGTSMAAPHVTGLIGLMYAYNPALPMTRVLEILGTDKNRPAASTPAPTLNAFDALVACRPDSLKDLADLNNDGKVDLQDFAIFKQDLKRVEGLGAASNLYLRSDLNGSGRLSRASADKRRVVNVEMSDLDVMIKAWNGTPPDLAAMLDQ